MNEPAFFETGNGFHVPAGLSLHPRMKSRCVPRIAHRRRSHDPDLVHTMRLHRALKTLERPQRRRHRFRRHQSRRKHACTQPRNFAVLMQRPQLVRYNLCDFQSAGIGTDINSGKSGHKRRTQSPKTRNQVLRPRYTTAAERRLGVGGASRNFVHESMASMHIEPFENSPLVFLRLRPRSPTMVRMRRLPQHDIRVASSDHLGVTRR